MSYFKNPDFTNARGTVVGHINSLTVDDRWERETAIFADALLRHIPKGPCTILDYGCGIGRISKAILDRHPQCTIVGVDNSEVQLQHARSYINNSRFSAIHPHEVTAKFDFAFSLYVLQHVQAIYVRQALQLIHANLATDGLFIQGCSKHRMAIRSDAPRFLDDSFLGVNIFEEIELLFEPLGDLFTQQDLQLEPLLRKIVLGETGEEEPGSSEVCGEPHPTLLYRRRDLAMPYWRLPMP